MDKRLLFFMVALSLALFGVNFYFQQEHEQQVLAWKEQQKNKKQGSLQKLQKEIEASSIETRALPLVELFLDSEGTQEAGWGLSDGKNIIALNRDAAPDLIYGKKSENQPLEKFTLSPIELPNNGRIYLASSGDVRVGDLPDFGQFSLQVASLAPIEATPAHYIDGSFTLLKNELAKLEEKPEETFNHDGVVLVKIDEEWMPVGIYNAKDKRVTWLEEVHGLKPLVISSKGNIIPASGTRSEEKFYVLENNYQQLVFSNYGAALAEINLPFQTEENKVSVVKEIEFDRDMVEHHPQNARFPSHPYFLTGNDKKQEGVLGGYYPLIRRDLIQNQGRKSVRVPPRFYALNIVSEYPEVAELVFEVKSFTKNQIVFESKQAIRKVTKTFTLPEDGGPYAIDLTIKIEGDSRGLWLTSGVPEMEWISGGPAPALKYRVTRNQKSSVEAISLPQDATTDNSLNLDWLVNSNGFFGTILDPLNETSPGYRAQFVSGTLAPSRLVEIDQEYDLYPADKMPGYQLLLPLKSTPGTMHFRIFAGPFASDILKKVDAIYTNSETGYNPDYIGAQTFHGWFSFISEPFAKFLFWLMQWFFWLTNSWALSIILLTVALRVMLYPLNAWSLKSTIRMQQIAPEVKAIQDKYKKDPQKSQMEIINLYRERGINPLSGCLPLLIQMPFLIGMFDLLKSTFELRGASFIPGWIDDLSAPDVLFSWKYPIFFIGNEFHLLPFLLGGVMFLQQRMMSPMPANPNEMTDQQRQQKAMGTMMTVVFTLMFYNFPSGLNIYWLSSMLLGILQQWWTNKQLSAKPLPAKK